MGTGIPLILHRREVRLHQHQPGVVTIRALAATDGAIAVGTPPERRRHRPRIHRLGLDRQARLLGRRSAAGTTKSLPRNAPGGYKHASQPTVPLLWDEAMRRL